MNLMAYKWKIILLIDGINWFWSIVGSAGGAGAGAVRLIYNTETAEATGSCILSAHLPECVRVQIKRSKCRMNRYEIQRL